MGDYPPATPERPLTLTLSPEYGREGSGGSTGRRGRRTVRVWRGGVVDFKKQRKIRFVKRGGAADGHRAGGVAVVGFGEADELMFLGMAEVEPILRGQFEGDFGGGCAGVGIKNFFEVLRDDLHQSIGQENRGLGGQAEHGGVGDFIELFADGLIYFGHAMAVDVAPERRDAVEIFVAVGVDEIHSFGAGDDQWVGVEPEGHGGEGVPEVLFVQGTKFCGVRIHLLLHRRALN